MIVGFKGISALRLIRKTKPCAQPSGLQNVRKKNEGKIMREHGRLNENHSSK